MRLLVERGLAIAGGIVGASGEISWPKPTRPGAILQVQTEIVERRRSRSRPERGVATVRSETGNQHGEIVQILIELSAEGKETHAGLDLQHARSH